MKMYKVETYYDGMIYMSDEEIRGYADNLADTMEQEDEYGSRPSTDTFDDCVDVLESAGASVYELDKIDKTILGIEI